MTRTIILTQMTQMRTESDDSDDSEIEGGVGILKRKGIVGLDWQTQNATQMALYQEQQKHLQHVSSFSSSINGVNGALDASQLCSSKCSTTTMLVSSSGCITSSCRTTTRSDSNYCLAVALQSTRSIWEKGSRYRNANGDALGVKRSQARAKVFSFCETLPAWLPEEESYYFQNSQNVERQTLLPLFQGHSVQESEKDMMNKAEEAEFFRPNSSYDREFSEEIIGSISCSTCLLKWQVILAAGKVLDGERR